MATLGPIPNSIIDLKTGHLTPDAKRWFSDLYLRLGGASGNSAPNSASYIVQTPSSDLANEQALSLLDSGFLKSTIGSGVVTSTGNTLIQSTDMSNTGVGPGAYTVNGQALYTVDAQGRIITSSSPTITITGTSNRVSVSGGTGGTPTVDISASYVGQASLTTIGTIATGVWQATSISTSYTDAKLKTLTGTSNRVTIGGTATDPTVNISVSYVGQSSITTVGTLSAGAIPESLLTFTDITTGDVSTTKHGFVPKVPNDVTKFLDGTGAFTTPSGSGGTGTITSFSAYCNTNQSLTTAVITKIAFDTETFDVNNDYDSATNYRWTPTVSGKYYVSCFINIVPTVLGTPVDMYIYKNGASYKTLTVYEPFASAPMSASIDSMISMNGTTDYLEIFIRQQSGFAQIITGGSTTTNFCGFRLPGS